MKNLIRLIISIIFLAFIIFGQIFLSNIFTEITPRIEVSSLEYNISSDRAFKYRDLTNLKGYNHSFRKETTGYVKDELVNIIITDGNYVRFKDFKLSKGSFFTDTASELGLNVAVISEDLAFRLFKTVNSIKNKIVINNITYTIVGVYKQNSLYSGLSSNGRNDIYIPCNSDFDMQFANDVGIQRLMIYSEGSESSEFLIKDISLDLRNITLATDHYVIKDYSNSMIIIQQFLKITGFIATIMLIVLICKYVIYELKKQEKYIREKLELLTLIDILIEDRLRFLKSLTIVFGLFMGIAALYKLSAFSFYIPGKYISSYRLFDFTLFKQLVQESIRHKNLYFSFKMSPYAIFYEFQLITNIVFMISEVILITKIYRYVNWFLFIEKYSLKAISQKLNQKLVNVVPKTPFFSKHQRGDI